MPNQHIKKYSSAKRKKTSLLLVFALTCLAAQGCRSTTDNQIDLLERELRTQEDYIYELEDYLVEYSEKLRDARCACPPQTVVYTEDLEDVEAAPKYSAPQGSAAKDNPEQSILEKRPSSELPEPKQPPKGESEEFSPENLEVPEIDFEIEEPVGYREPSNPLRQASAARSANSLRGRKLVEIPDPVDFVAEEELEDARYENEYYEDEQFVAEDAFVDEELIEDDQLQQTLAPINRVAQRLEVKQLFSGGETSQSLLAVVEGLDEHNEPVDLEGEVSLMVMTGDREAPQRLKRWNFSAEETVAAWQSSDLGDGLHLELPLEQVELPEGTVELWVRLVTSDGRKLLTQLPFQHDRLGDVDSYVPPENPTQNSENGLVLVDNDEFVTEPIEASSNTLHSSSDPSRAERKVEVAQSQPKKEKPRWRASMRRTDHTAEGFATTSGTAKGWIAQPLSRQQQYAPASVASHKTAVKTKPEPIEQQPTAKWTTVR